MLSLELTWLLALIPLPLLVLLLPSTNQQNAALKVPTLLPWQQASDGSSGSSGTNFLKIMLLFAVWILLVLAASKPIWRGEPIAQQASGRDLQLAVDISGSMELADMVLDGGQVDRLSMVKQVVGEFVKRRQTDRLGLIAFGSKAYQHVPLTFDGKTLNVLLSELEIGFAGQKTAIGDAIAMAVKQLQNQPENNRVLILLTDGANTAGAVTPLDALELAKKIKLKIYTIGVGSNEYVQRSIFGNRKVNPSRDLDETLLQNIADETQGQYFRAASTQELRDIYSLLDELEPIAKDTTTIRPQKSLAHWPLAGALNIAFITLLITNAVRIRRRIKDV